MPVEGLIVIPLLPLAEFASHKEQFLPGMRIHPRVKHPQIGEFLPEVARHLLEQRPFAVHHLIMAQDEDEVFMECVEKRKSNVSLVKASMDRIFLHVAEKVVHPTHVPFEAEAKTAEVGGAGDTGPCRGFLGDGDDAGEAFITDFVETLEEVDCLEVFA